MTITNVPAAAGNYIIWPASDSDGYRRVPVLAWRGERFVYPVMQMGPENVPDGAAHLCPDGSVNAMDFDKWWPSVNEWLSEVRPRKSGPVRVAG